MAVVEFESYFGSEISTKARQKKGEEVVRIRPVPLPGVCPRSSYKIRRELTEKVAQISARNAVRKCLVEKILAPLVVAMPDQPHQLARSVQRERPRPALQFDSRFFRRAVALAVIACIAARHQIFPRRASAARSRHNVIERQLRCREIRARRTGKCSGRAARIFFREMRGSAAECAGSSTGESRTEPASNFCVECTLDELVSSACATPLSISTRARRTAVTLIGSNVALRTRTGACITEGRLAGEGIAFVAAESGAYSTSAQYRPGS